MNENKTYFGTPYDDVFRTQLVDCSYLIIPVINELFDTDYDLKEKVILWQNEHFILGENKRITDSMIQIGTDSDFFYHIECESSREDGSVIIRVAEYSFSAALEQSVYHDGTITIRLPHSAVLFLRGQKNRDHDMHVDIITPGGQISYPVPVLRMCKYDLDSLFEKKLYFLLPFYLFNLESEFKVICSDETKISELKSRYSEILSGLNRLQDKGKLSTYAVRLIMEMIVKVANGLAAGFEPVRKGVDEIMGGQVLDYEAKRILNQGRAEGREEGRAEGREEGRAEGHVEGQELLAGAIHELRLGRSREELLKSGYDENTVNLALTCL